MSTATAAPVAPVATRRSVLNGGLWSAASQVVPAFGTALLSVAAGRVLGSGPLGQQSLIAYLNSALSSVVVISLNTTLLQVGGMLQGRRDAARLRGLMRWSVSSHLAAGLVVLAVMVVSGEVADQNRLAWAVVGAVSVLDAATDGLAIRLILIEGWAPIGRLRLVFQLIGPLLGIAFLFAGLGIVGIFLGDGVAALGLLLAVLPRFGRLREAVPLPAAPETVRRPRPGPGGPLGPSVDRPPASRPSLSQPSLSQPSLSQPSGAIVSEPGLPGPRAEDLRNRWRLRAPTPVLRTFALFAVGALITQVVSKRVEFLVLAADSGDVAVGMYSVAFMAVSLLSMIPLGVATAAMPLVAAAEGRGDILPAARHLNMALRVGTAVTLPFVGLLAALGPAAVTLVYGPDYRTASLLVPFASSALLVSVVAGVCAQFWSGRGRLRVVLVSGTAAGVVDLGVALALVPAFGATGATAANIAGQVVLAAGLLRATVRELGPTGWQPRSLLGAGLSAVLAASAALEVGLGIDVFVPVGIEARSLLIVVLGAAAGGGVGLLAARVLKIFDADECEWMAAMVPRRLAASVTAMSRPARHRSQHGVAR